MKSFLGSLANWVILPLLYGLVAIGGAAAGIFLSQRYPYIAATVVVLSVAWGLGIAVMGTVKYFK